LRAEREAYLVRGLMERVAEVDRVLASFGEKSDATVVETAAMDVAVEQTKVVRWRKRKKA
jgi:hypothetical protein